LLRQPSGLPPTTSSILLCQTSLSQQHNIIKNVGSNQKTASSGDAYWPQTFDRSYSHIAISSPSACFNADLSNCKWRREKPIYTGRDSSLRASSNAKTRRRRFESQLEQRGI
jgi:hypothetical protein